LIVYFCLINFEFCILIAFDIAINRVIKKIGVKIPLQFQMSFYTNKLNREIWPVIRNHN
jgi:hypothetical protein